jgi:hypothetical protein
MMHTSEQGGPDRPGFSRRGFLTGASVLVGLGSVGLATSGAAAAAPAGRPAALSVAPVVAAHPRLLHTAADLTAATQRVSAGQAPWTASWARLTANGRSSSAWSPRPLETVVRGGTGQNYAQLYPDVHAAYQNALRWRIAGSAAHGSTAVSILNAWSSTLTTVTGNADRFLAAGLYGYQLANAGELVRDHPDFDLDGFSGMLETIFAPMNEDFLAHHNNAVITNYWANWDLCAMASLLAIGSFADRTDLVDRAVGYFESGAGNGSIQHAVPYLYPDEGLGQWQESGRDQGHTVLGVGLMGAFCEMAWNRGIDCYGYDDNRFLKGAEYVARYNLGHDVPFTPYTWHSGPSTTAPHAGWQTQTQVSAASRGIVRPVWDLVLGHYAGRRGLDAPWVQQMAESVRPEGGGGDYGPESGGYDQLGFGTLMHYRP